MNTNHLERVQAIFEEVMQLPTEQRLVYLDKLNVEEPVLCDEVRSLMSADAQSKSWDSGSVAVNRLASPRSFDSGDEIGSFCIVAKIGEGGMGVIYKALDKKLQRHVALKFLPPGQNTDEQFRERFLSEARAASRLDHPNICVIHDVAETPDGQLYITMPCYEGETLAKRITRGAMTHVEAINTAISVAQGLASAHMNNIVHRDIKPANIMLTHDGGIKILDFGISKMANNDLTGAGVSIGTLAYMSPEQLRGEVVDARADIWALGTVLYEMLLGKQAFPAKSLSDVLQAALNEEYPELDSVVLPEVFLDILERTLARKLEQRFESMQAMIDALHQAYDLLSSSTATSQDAKVNDDITRIIVPQRRKRAKSYKWDENLLSQIIEILVPVLGPIAPIMVKRKAAEAEDLQQLTALLSGAITDQTDRQQFNAKMKIKITEFTSPPLPQALKTDGSLAGVELSSVQLADIESALIDILGPITQTLIKRHAQKATSLNELFESLSRHIDNDSQEQHFLNDMHKKYPQN